MVQFMPAEEVRASATRDTQAALGGLDIARADDSACGADGDVGWISKVKEELGMARGGIRLQSLMLKSNKPFHRCFGIAARRIGCMSPSSILHA